MAAVVAAGALVLEARGGGAIAPDLLLAAAVALAGRPGGSLGAAAALGVARDAIAGGPAGAFAIGFTLAGVLARAALGGARRRGLVTLALLVFLGGVLAYAMAALPAALRARSLAPLLLRDALRTAALTALFSPVVAVPLAAIEALAGGRPKIDLSREARP